MKKYEYYYTLIENDENINKALIPFTKEGWRIHTFKTERIFAASVLFEREIENA